MPKIQKVRHSLHVCLPKDQCRLLGWEKGTAIACYTGTKPKTLVLE